MLSSRTQRQHWSRDRQIDACKSIIAESTRCQLALRRKWKRNEPIDWIAWNEALALIWLVGPERVIAAAYRMDELFWVEHGRIKDGEVTDEYAWAAARDAMEEARLDFINAVRDEILRSPEQLDDKPVARPPLTPRAQQSVAE